MMSSDSHHYQKLTNCEQGSEGLEMPLVHSCPHCQIHYSFLITSWASVKQPGHVWPWAVLIMNPTEQTGGWGGGDPVGGKDGVFFLAHFKVIGRL